MRASKMSYEKELKSIKQYKIFGVSMIPVVIIGIILIWQKRRIRNLLMRR